MRGTLKVNVMVLCDTNIFIEIYRGNGGIESIVSRIGTENIAVSDVTCAELFFGAKNKQELAAISRNLQSVYTLPICEQISAMATALVERFCLSHRLNLPDALIGATAIFHNMPLFTLNRKDFQYLPDITLYNP
jgi:predicted nucleic acid-binding protein